MTVIRKIKESPLEQGISERVAYRLTTTPWGSSPSSPATTLYDITSGAYTDKSDTMLSGSSVVSSDVITTPLVISLTEGHRYRLEIAFVVDGNTFEAYAEIVAKK